MKIIETGNTLRVLDTLDVKINEFIAPKQYKLQMDKQGFFLEELSPVTVNRDELYGEHTQKVDKIKNAFKQGSGTLGAMFAGSKGIGKSLTTNLLVQELQHEEGLPVIFVTRAFPGVPDFIQSVKQPAVWVFDEFEKVFDDDPDADMDYTRQQDMLSVLDGMNPNHHLYLMTVNRIELVSSYILSRPGRVRYLINFEYPDFDAIKQFVEDKVSDVSDKMITDIQNLSLSTPLNFDKLTAITEEIKLFPELELATIISDLNIIRKDYDAKPSYSIYINSQEIPSDITGGYLRFAVNGVTEQVDTDYITEEFDVGMHVESVPLLSVLDGYYSENMQEDKKERLGKVFIKRTQFKSTKLTF